MIKFIAKLLKFIFTIFVAFIVFAYLFSLKSNMSFESTISYFKGIGKEFFSINDSENIISDPDESTIFTSSNNHYYYDQLDDNSKIIYSGLENNINNLKKENYVIDFSTTFNELLQTSLGQYKLNKAFQSALDAFFYDHPELFYIDLTKIALNTKCISIGPMKSYTVELAPKDDNYLIDDFDSFEEVNVAIKKVENIKKNIVNDLSGKSVYNKILSIHNMLINSIDYDTTYTKSNTHNIYGALVEKEVICEGYAKTFKYLMDSLNIECILVPGTSSNSSGNTEAHMWNYVKINDQWYGVDVTWDDPIIIGGSLKNNLRYDYFLKGRTVFASSHTPSGKISDTGMLFILPTLSNTNYK